MAGPTLRTSRGNREVVVGAIDDYMVYPALIWAYSLHTQASRSPHILIGFIRGLLAENNRAIISCTLRHLEISHEFLELAPDSRFIGQGHISSTTFAKFLLADAVRGRNVWIDVDTVATRGWDSIFARIQESPEYAKLVVADREKSHPYDLNNIDNPSDLPFNAGVLGWPDRPRLSWSDQLDHAGDVVTKEQFLFNLLYASSLANIPETYNTLSHRRDHLRDGKLPFILHFAGAHKPWHLPRRYASICSAYQCPWSLWFEAEREMLKSLEKSSCLEPVDTLRFSALKSGIIEKSRDYSGRLLLAFLQRIGILGWIVLIVAKPFSRWIPRGTHPLH